MVGSLSLDVLRKSLDWHSVHGLADEEVLGHKLDLTISKVFFDLLNSVILEFKGIFLHKSILKEKKANQDLLFQPKVKEAQTSDIIKRHTALEQLLY